MTVSQPPVPQLPDPTVVAEALTTLMQNAAAAVRTTMAQAATPQALPYDPTTLTRAMIDFNTAVMTQPAALLEAQARNWNDWTALWRTMGERAMGQPSNPSQPRPRATAGSRTRPGATSRSMTI